MFAEHAKSMEIVSPTSVVSGDKVKCVQLNMLFERNGKEYTVDKTVSLRNIPTFKMYEVTIP